MASTELHFDPLTQTEILAPDFELADTQGHLIRLSNYRGHQSVILIFLRGFM
jgi:peroxiredoxin